MSEKEKSSSSSSSGIGFIGLLTIVFITLKLTGYIDWPWLYVLAPALIGVGLVLLILMGFLGFVIYSALSERK